MITLRGHNGVDAVRVANVLVAICDALTALDKHITDTRESRG